MKMPWLDRARIVSLQPLSILHVDSELAWRGGQQALITLARGLRARGHSQAIATPAQSALRDEAEAEGVAVTALDGSRGLRRLLREQRFDVVHAHSGRGQNLAFLGALGLRVPRVVTRHVAFAPRHPLVHRLKYTLTCDAIIAVSQSVRNVLMQAGVQGERITVVHTGVELPALLPAAEHRRAARESFGVDDAEFVIGHMGAFTREKGQDVAIAAEALLPREWNVRLLLAGDGARFDILRSEAGARVVFPGFVEDRAAFYAALDLFVMPSRSEAWGLAALEAMAHGVPVVASDVGGLAEIVVHGSGGWLVPAGDPMALANAIVDASRGDLGPQSSAARARAGEFSVDRTAALTEGVYQALVRGRPERPPQAEGLPHSQ